MPTLSRPVALLLGLVLMAMPVRAQLPMMTAPAGTLRIELGGGFFPTDRRFVNGTSQSLGESVARGPLDAGSITLIPDMSAALAPLLGRPASGGSLGSVTAIAERQRGVGTIGLAWGITRRLTLAATLPIVSVRTQLQLRSDTTGATLGLNPGDPALGSAQGIAQNATYFGQFTTALEVLAQQVADGAYAGTPALQQLAEQTLAEGGAYRDALATALASTAILPVVGSTDAELLRGLAENYRSRFEEAFGITAVTTEPALPAAPLSAAQFDALLSAPTGLGLRPFGEDPIVGLGDVRLELTGALTLRGAPGEASWLGIWGHAGGTLATGTPPRPEALLDQGTGEGHGTIFGGVTAEIGRGRLGLRGHARYTHALSSEVEARVGPSDILLVGANRQGLLTRQAGSTLAISAQPFVRVAPRLAITGSVLWWQRGDDAWSWGATQAPLAGLDPAIMNAGTGADALLVGIGLSYSHDGNHRDATGRMPVEAAFGIERTVRSGAGLVDAPLTARVTFRLYKALRGR
jgi:hypothetical protein